jgi:deazaflavin-dependent oxidoreductase (nitroreductase family)
VWLLAQKPWIVPIPGGGRLERLDENIGAVAAELTSNGLYEIERGAYGGGGSVPTTSGANDLSLREPDGDQLLRNMPQSTRIIPNLSRWDRGSNGSEASMTSADLHSVAEKQILYLTTIGRTTGLPRPIEIWFVVYRERFYVFAERGEAAGWVKNIRHNPKVTVLIGEWRIDATARVLDRQADRKQWDLVAAMADHKYGWGEGLPVEITPLP